MKKGYKLIKRLLVLTVLFSVLFGGFATVGAETDISNATIKLYKAPGEAASDTDYWVWTGSEINPVVEVTIGGTQLVKDTDYTVTYNNCTNTSTQNSPAEVVINGIGNYSGTKKKAFAIIPKDATLSSDLTFNTLTYNGTSQQVIKSPAESAQADKFRYGWYSSTTSSADPSTTYTDYSDAQLKLKDAGDYKLYIEMVPLKGYTYNPYSKNVTIAKKDPEIGLPTLASNLTYNNTDQKLITVAATADPVDTADKTDGENTIYYAVTTVDTAPSADAANTWKTNYQDVTAKGAGTYYVWYRVKGTKNFNDIAPTKVGSVVIDKYTLSLDSYTDQTKTYTGSPISADDLMSKCSLVGGETYSATTHGTITYKYSKWVSDGNYETATTTAPTVTNNEKAYKVDVTFPASDNYNEVSTTIYLTIERATPSIAGLANKSSLVYSGLAQELITPVSSSNGETTFEYSLGTATAAGDTWNSTIPTGTGAEKYYVWYKAAQTDNYKAITSTLLSPYAEIEKATPIVNVSNKTETYTGSAITDEDATLTLVNGETGGTITYTYHTDSACQTTAVSAINAGTYYVKASVAEQANYKAASNISTLTINPLTVTDSIVTITGINTNYDYTASEIKPTPTVVVNSATLTDGTDYDVTYSNNTNVGTATATITFKGNYSGVQTKSFIIDKVNPTVTAPVVVSSLTFTNAEQDLLSDNGTVSNTCTLEYAFGESDSVLGNSPTWSSSVPKKTNVGTYYIWYRVVGNSNYNDVNPTYVNSVTINKATIAVTVGIKQELNGDLTITCDNKDYLEKIADDGQVIITFTDTASQTQTSTIENTVSDTDAIKVVKNGANATDYLTIPYSKFRDNNIKIYKFNPKTAGSTTPNTFSLLIKEANYEDKSITSVNTTRGIEYINLYAQTGANQLTQADQTLGNNAVFYVDGKKLTAAEGQAVEIVDNEIKLVQTYTYVSTTDPITERTNYPTNFNVYEINQANVGDPAYTSVASIKHLDGLDDLLVYSGTSIRVSSNQSNGIRVITGIPNTVRNNLISSNVEGYKLVRYGTVMSWADDCATPYLVKGQSGVYTAINGAASGNAYANNGYYNAIFATDANKTYFTNVLIETGNSWSGKLDKDFVFRPFMVIRPVGATDATTDLVIYGGSVNRSIYYVANQNKTQNPTFYNSNASIKAYIDAIIAAVQPQ